MKDPNDLDIDKKQRFHLDGIVVHLLRRLRMA